MDILDSAPFGFAHLEKDRDGGSRAEDYRFVRVNGAFRAFTGLGSERVEDRTPGEVSAEIAGVSLEWIGRCAEELTVGEALLFEHHVAHGNRWLQVHAHAPAPHSIAILLLDVSETGPTPEEDGESLRTIVESLPAVVYRRRYDREWTMLLVTDPVTRLSGYGPADFTDPGGQRFGNIIHPGDRERVDREISKSIEAHAPWEVDYRLLTAQGRVVWVRDRGQAEGDRTGAPTHVVGLIVAIPAGERARGGSPTLEQVAARISTRFLSATTADQFTESVERTLADLGVVLSVDRAHLFRVSPGFSRMENTHEWCAPGIEGLKEQFREIRTDSIPWARDQLITGKPLIIPEVSALPVQALAEQKLFVSQGIRSLLNLPIRRPDGRFVGFVGFHSIRRSLTWRDSEVAILRVLADAMGSALDRIRPGSA